ncbi:haloacid dehalogenase type II [Effusibacillus pohliae]|uniref:haloacid dehalogenase type II n=1 Tax=Effusibacillus pohliae TaxID=232270 RepID=UPI0003766C7B|nr:haloacid dehalogenase type II [Effusibacillus pohliae]
MLEAVVFDAYGTLFDVHSVIAACEQMYPGRGALISQTWRQKQLEYTWLRALMRRYEDFETVNRDSLRFTLSKFELPYTRETIDRLANAYLGLAPYPDVLQALQAFQPNPLLILSNGTVPMLRTVVENAGLRAYFTDILSVDMLKTYKPDPRVYQLAVDRLGIPKANVLFVSSNGWDVAGAKSFGFTVGWINRTGSVTEELGVKPDYTVQSLLELAELISR